MWICLSKYRILYRFQEKKIEIFAFFVDFQDFLIFVCFFGRVNPLT